MEIDVTDFVLHGEAERFSASAAELGADAGGITWGNALSAAAAAPLLTTEAQLEQARDWAGDFGAWSDEEITAWSPTQINALVLQFLAGSLREIKRSCIDADGDIDWTKAEQLANAGNIGGDVYPGDDGRFYFYLGS